MANYPTHEILLGSTKEEEAGIVDDFSQAGTQHSRTFYTGRYRFMLIHQLSVTEFNALKTTYDAGPRDNYTLTYYSESPAATYTVKFTGPPQIVENLALNRVFVQVPLRGTRN
jgi:hypothetical protein